MGEGGGVEEDDRELERAADRRSFRSWQGLPRRGSNASSTA